jgi:nucleoside phosphorylase
MEDRIEVFIAFDQEDVTYLRELKNQLKPLEMQGLITTWDATQILGGVNREQAISDHLKTASIILLLVSASFLASREAYKLIKQAVAKNAPPEVFVVPILLHDVYWEGSDIGALEPYPKNRKPVSSWQNRNAAYLDVVKGVREIVAMQQEAFARKDVGLPLHAKEEAISNPERLDYKVEDQSWYARDFPQATEIDQEQIDVLKKEIDVVIITARPVEMRAVMHLLEPYPRRRSILLAYIGPETYYLGKSGAYKTVVTQCRMGSYDEGSVNFAVPEAQDVWHPRAIIMVGIAFGKDPTKQKMGDVLVATQIIPYERIRVGEQDIFRGPIPPSNITLLNRFENVPTWHFPRPDGKECDLIPGPILSGEKLVDDPDFKRQLFQRFPQAIGGEMEGAGLAAASGRRGIAWILVKSICDWGDGKKHKQEQPLAAAAAASLVHHVLSKRTTLNSIEKR